MTGPESAIALARAIRVMSRLGHFDPTCHASVRAENGFLVSPNFDRAQQTSPRRVAPEDVLQIEPSGVGGGAPAHVVELHRAIYETRDDVGAVILCYPPVAMAALASGYRLRKVTHAEAWLSELVSLVIDLDRYFEAPPDAVAAIGSEDRVIPVAGVGIMFLASDIDDAISIAYSYEYLARMNLITLGLTRAPREVTVEEIDAIQAERATPETVGSVDAGAFLRSFDAPWCPVLLDDGTINARVAIACRILASHRTLVGFYEHVSHRAEDNSTFAMSPAQNFNQIDPDDILVVGLDEDASWIGGSHAPAPFRRFHRDIFVARPDVNAIVHTHEMYGRALVAAGMDLPALDRFGVGQPSRPAFLGRASMVFGSRDRGDAVKALGAGSVYHTDLHGTDYVAATMEEATVMAVHRELASRALCDALRFGEPEPLSDEDIALLAPRLPSVVTWWRFYLDLLADEKPKDTTEASYG